MSEASTGSQLLFHEVQRPRWSVWLVVLSVFWGAGLLAALVVSWRAGRGVTPFHVVHILFFLGALIAGMSQLRTIVDGHRLDLERRWGARVTIDLRTVRTVREAAYYRAIDGGWGVKDGRCVILSYGDGEVLYVGSSRSDELCAVIRSRAPRPAVPSPLEVGRAAPAARSS